MSRGLQSLIDDVRPVAFGFNSLFDNILHTNFEGFPKTNIITYGKDGETLVIEIALAGYSKDDITVEREDNALKVTGKNVARELDETAQVVKSEIAKRSFEKVFAISDRYKDINVKFENGLLSIVLEKEPEELHKSRLIEIK